MEAAKYIRIKISPERLDNPDLDIRYILPNLIIDNSEGLIEDGGYDYLEDEVNTMLIYLQTANPDHAVKKILEVIEKIEVLDNDLKQSIEIEVENEPNSENYQSVYKPYYQRPDSQLVEYGWYPPGG